MNFPVLSLDTAPADARATIDRFSQAWGFLPNLGGVMAASPASLELLWVAYQAMSKGSFTAEEQHLVAVAISRENDCRYCVAAHSTLALGIGMSASTLRAVRDGHAVDDAKLEQLRRAAARLVQARGWLSEGEKRSFFDAGYTPGQLLELVGWVALKTLTNYVNHLAQTPMDGAWQAQAWEPAEATR